MEKINRKQWTHVSDHLVSIMANKNQAE